MKNEITFKETKGAILVKLRGGRKTQEHVPKVVYNRKKNKPKKLVLDYPQN